MTLTEVLLIFIVVELWAITSLLAGAFEESNLRWKLITNPLSNLLIDVIMIRSAFFFLVILGGVVWGIVWGMQKFVLP